MKKIEKIERAAKLMRSILEQIKDELSEAGYSPFMSFPEGCCEYSSLFLGVYLIKSQLCSEDELEMPYNNVHDSGCSHGWLRVNGTLIVDITADQFDEIKDTVIITESSDFHRSFKYGEWWSFSKSYRMNSTDSNSERFSKAWSKIEKVAEQGSVHQSATRCESNLS